MENRYRKAAGAGKLIIIVSTTEGQVNTYTRRDGTCHVPHSLESLTLSHIKNILVFYEYNIHFNTSNTFTYTIPTAEFSTRTRRDESSD